MIRTWQVRTETGENHISSERPERKWLRGLPRIMRSDLTDQNTARDMSRLHAFRTKDQEEWSAKSARASHPDQKTPTFHINGIQEDYLKIHTEKRR